MRRLCPPLIVFLLHGCAAGGLDDADAGAEAGAADLGPPGRGSILPPLPEAGVLDRDAATELDGGAVDLGAASDAAEAPREDSASPDAAPAPDGAPPPGCAESGPAFVHGDLWAFWFNGRVACDRQHKWVWICEQRLGPEACDLERQWFDDCWNARGSFPPSDWEGSTPTPHSPNWGVCQPHHWPEKNGGTRPGNTVPCDTTGFDYGALRVADPFYGVDWWAGAVGMRHLTVKVFEAGQDPLASEGRADGLVNLSTHPGDRDALMEGLSNHGFAGGTRPRGGCIHGPEGDHEAPGLAQSFGAFAWLEVPTDRPVTLAAGWNGLLGGDVGLSCLQGLDFFPPQFGAHGVDGKPWFISSPCFDVLAGAQFEPGRHYAWDLRGLRRLDGCDGPPPGVLAGVPEAKRADFQAGTCSAPD